MPPNDPVPDAEDEDNATKHNPLEMLDAFESVREMWQGLVAAVMADGFTEEQARALVTTAVTGHRFD